GVGQLWLSENDLIRGLLVARLVDQVVSIAEQSGITAADESFDVTAIFGSQRGEQRWILRDLLPPTEPLDEHAGAAHACLAVSVDLCAHRLEQHLLID